MATTTTPTNQSHGTTTSPKSTMATFSSPRTATPPVPVPQSPINISFSVISILLPILAGFANLKYQNQDKTLFETHPKTVLMAIFSLLLCCIYYHCLQRIRLQQQGRPTMLVHVFYSCILFFGYMAVLALSSILFSDSDSPAIYVLCIIISIIISVGDLWVYQRIRGTHEESQSGTSTSPANLPGSECVTIEIDSLQTFTSPANPQRIRGTHEESQLGTSTSPANLHEAMEDPGSECVSIPLQTFTSPANLPDAMEANLHDAIAQSV